MATALVTLEGICCGIPACMGLMEKKLASADSKYGNKCYWVCSNWQFHNDHKEKGDPEKGPWIADEQNAMKNFIRKVNGPPPAEVAAKRAAEVDAGAPPAKKSTYTVSPPLAVDCHGVLVDIRLELQAIRELMVNALPAAVPPVDEQ